MTKRKKIWLGIFTFLPIILVVLYIIIFAIYMFSFAEVIDSQAGDPNVSPPGMFFGMFGIMFALIILAVISSFVLLIYYIIHANDNPNFDSNQKLIWILVLIFANGIGNIIYYFVEILPKDKNPTLPASV